MRLARVILFAKDLPRLRTFYQDALGLPALGTHGTDTWFELDAGTAALALHAIPEVHAAGIVITDPPKRRSSAVTKLAFYVDDVEQARATLVARGVAMGDLVRWDQRAFCDGVDPEGNVFQISDG